MSGYKEKIHELEKANAEDRRKITEHRISCGRMLYDRKHAAVTGDELASVREEIEGLTERLEDTERKIARIMEINTRNGEIKDEIARSRREISRLESEVVPVFEQIGERAFELYRNNDYLENEYTDQFRDLVRHQNEIDEIEREIGEQESAGDDLPLLRRLVSGGRLALLRSRRSNRLEAFPKLYRKAGAALCETDFLSAMNDPQLNQSAEPYLAARRRIEQLENSIAELDHERERLRAELHEMDAERRPARTISDLQERSRELTARLNECFGRLTDYLFESEADTTGLPEEARDALAEIRRLETEQENRQLLINRLEAAIEAAQSEKEIEQLEQRSAVLRQRLGEIENEIEKNAAAIEETKQKREHLLALRGSVDDL